MKQLTLSMMILFLAMNAMATDYYVSPSGSDSNNGTSLSTPWQTLSHANDNFVLGSGVGGIGTTIHVQAGTYSTHINPCGTGYAAICATRGGTAGARLVWQCDAPNYGCVLSSAAILVTGQNAHHIDFKGFGLTSPLSSTGFIMQCGTAYGPDSGSTGCVSIHLIGNYFHDFGTALCSKAGVITSAIGTAATIAAGQQIPVVDFQLIGNRVNNVGDNAHAATYPNGCQFYHGMYLPGGKNPGDLIVQNNIISNVIGWGIHFYHTPCNAVITNNLLVHNGRGGILVQLYPAGDPACPNGYGHNIVSNNIIIDNCILSHAPCPAPTEYAGISDSATISTNPSYYDNNLLFGNQPTDQIETYYQGAAGTSSGAHVSGTINAAPSTVFVNFNDDPNLADYHLKPGSPAIGTGTSNCHGLVSTCIPTTDLSGTTRSSPTSLGVYEAIVSAVTPPTNLTATVK